MTPKKRSMDKLRAEGWMITDGEKWVPASPAGYKGPLITRDLFGFGDLLGVKIGIPGATLFQVTTGANLNARLEKIMGLAEVGIWRASGNSIVVHGWRKIGARGKRKLWQCREIVL